MTTTSSMRAFSANRDRTFLWLRGAHRDGFDVLYDGTVRGSPLLILTGDVGAGKTMLTDAVAARLADETAIVGRIAHPSRDVDDLWNAVAAAFGLATDARGREAAAAGFAQLIRQATRTSTRVLLIIDEAQSLTSEVLAEVARVCDAARDAGGATTLTVLLVGEDQLDRTLARPELVPLAALVAVRRRLPALRECDVASYIRHRLACAEAPRDLFTAEALTAVARLSGGIPRLIDTLCARAVASGDVVDATLVERCAREMAWLTAAGPTAPGGERTRAGRRRRRMVVAALAGGAALTLSATVSDERPQHARHADRAAPRTEPTSIERAPAPAGPAIREAAPRPERIEREPDPAAIIDWLLARPSRPAAVGR